MFLGFGLNGVRRMAASVRTLESGLPEFTVPHWLQRLLGQGMLPSPTPRSALPYIHGVEPVEHPLHRPLRRTSKGGTRWWAPRNPARAWRWPT